VPWLRYAYLSSQWSVFGGEGRRLVSSFFYSFACRLLLLQLPLEEKAGSTSFHFVFGNVLDRLLQQDKIL
jgi:hypothetical protein